MNMQNVKNELVKRSYAEQLERSHSREHQDPRISQIIATKQHYTSLQGPINQEVGDGLAATEEHARKARKLQLRSQNTSVADESLLLQQMDVSRMNSQYLRHQSNIKVAEMNLMPFRSVNDFLKKDDVLMERANANHC